MLVNVPCRSGKSRAYEISEPVPDRNRHRKLFGNPKIDLRSYIKDINHIKTLNVKGFNH